MNIHEVPQDRGMITDERREVCYAVDENGRYVLAGSAGWEPKNIANQQAWNLIGQMAARALEKIHAGQKSPLAYHMAVHQMDVGLLARYTGISRLRIWLHLKPGPFQRLTDRDLKPYADIFDISIETLKSVPDTLRHHAFSETIHDGSVQ
ncbi:hypothetical protein LJC71_06110 [Desulfosarcina sp. OttesenSCG-928-A07]|nr:hypothetical protein [Desulfosarcina sp. OttesenSCG-928-A07]